MALREDGEVTGSDIVARAESGLRPDRHVAGHEHLGCRVGLDRRTPAHPEAAEDVAAAGQDQPSMARCGPADVHVSVHARGQRALVAGSHVDRGSSRAIRELVGEAARGREIVDERPLELRPGSALRRGVRDGRGKEELRAA